MITMFLPDQRQSLIISLNGSWYRTTAAIFSYVLFYNTHTLELELSFADGQCGQQSWLTHRIAISTGGDS